MLTQVGGHAACVSHMHSKYVAFGMRSSLLCVCACVSERGGGVQPFRMSGAVSGHQSARQRQAEQIISRDIAGNGKERLREKR